MIGRPIHFRVKSPGGTFQTACGLHGSGITASWDPRDVECLRCRQTNRWHIGLKGKPRR